MESRPIEGYEDYTIFANGFVINSKGKFLKPSVDTRGYLRVWLYKLGKRKTCNIHRLVCQAFIPNPDNKKCVDHIDRNKLNNWKSNLRWASDSDNNRNRSKQDSVLFRGVHLIRNNRWIARYFNVEGHRKSKSFSINRFGNKQALRLAVEFRYQMELQYDYTILQTPTEFFNSETFLNLV